MKKRKEGRKEREGERSNQIIVQKWNNYVILSTA
jgi:hypothetical protein